MTFQVWFFTEMPYPHLPQEDDYESVRVSLPNRYYDPKLGESDYNNYFELYRIADEVGLDLMLNEHHSTPTCMDVAAPISLGILARETKRARLLLLGNPVGNRREPVRVAEEMAMCDVISGGRVEVGLVRSVPYEVTPQNSNPVTLRNRFWEAIDLIQNAWTSHEGPFAWQGDFFEHRHVNIWPRPMQSPHPPIWIASQSPSGAREVAEHGFNLACILNGTRRAKELFEIYRSAIVTDKTDVSSDLGYCALVAVGETDAEGYNNAMALREMFGVSKIGPQFLDPPGYADARQRATMFPGRLKGEGLSRSVASLASMPIEELVETGFLFAGSPQSVVDQVRRFYDRVGGFGHLIAESHAWAMPFDTAAKSLRLLGEQVLPSLADQLSV